MYGRNQNNIVKQRSSKKIFKKRERVSQERGRGKNPQMQERREENPQSDGEGRPWTTAALDSNQLSLEQDKNWKIFLYIIVHIVLSWLLFCIRLCCKFFHHLQPSVKVFYTVSGLVLLEKARTKGLRNKEI